jgi:hypothetical protein
MMNKTKIFSHPAIWAALLALPALALSGRLAGQWPATDLYVFDLEQEPKGWTLRRPVLLSAGGEGRYHNQPWFAGESLLLISSDAAEPGRTDIWALDLDKKERRRISTGPASWFSPRYRPGSGGLTAISLEPDTRQFLQHCPENDPHRCAPLLPAQDRAGYYAWHDATSLALFMVGEPHELHWHDLEKGKAHRICLDPGRQFVFDETGCLHYLQKVTPESWYLKIYDPRDGHSKMVTRALDGSEDFCLLPDGSYLMTSKSNIWHFHPEHHLFWQPLADLSVFGLHQLTRIAHFQGKRLAIVNQRP